ncbi:TPA: hypothetical protein QCY16_005007 [Bacillus cereus]|nr:hypothetical protein [Bacillus cereus]
MWIEIINVIEKEKETKVVPYIGAWIEIPADATSLPTFCVAPHKGTWIEIT